MWVLIIIAVVLIALAIEYPWLWAVIAGIVGLFIWGMIWAARSEKKEKEREEREEEQYRTQEQKRKENFQNRLSSNIIITDVVPQVGKKWATELIEEFKSYTYMKRSLNVKVFDDHISIGSTSIYFNQYGLKNLYDDDRIDVYWAVRDALQESVRAELKARMNTHYSVTSEYEYNSSMPFGLINCTIGIDTRQSW